LALAYTSGGRRNELLNLTWVDIDFETQTVRFVPKQGSEGILAWEPKDHEIREVPIPSQTLQLLVDLQLEAEEAGPYIFITKARLSHILDRRSKGEWEPDSEIVNNLIRDLKAVSRRVGVNPFTLHDLRRSCITNWARKLPIQTVQHLAGHSSVETTRKYYLSVQQRDLDLARRLQSKVMSKLTNY
jgi:integrase